MAIVAQEAGEIMHKASKNKRKSKLKGPSHDKRRHVPQNAVHGNVSSRWEGSVSESGNEELSDAAKATLASLLAHADSMAETGQLIPQHLLVLKHLIATRPQSLLHKSYAFQAQLPADRWRDTIEEALPEALNERWEEVGLMSKYSVDKAKEISNKERAKLMEHSGLRQGPDSLTYGEIGFPSFASLFQDHLREAKLRDGIFYDIGSGTGRGVFAAWLLADFQRVVGIELMESLYDISVEALGTFKKSIAPRGTKGKGGAGAADVDVQWPWPDPSSIELIKGDFRKVDWSDGDVVFCASTCFDPPMMKWLAEEGAKLRPGAYFVTLTYRLDEHCKALEHVRETVYRMSWGRCSVHIHRRRSEDSE